MSKPDGSQKSPTCTTCGQPLPPEPVYVGPGDKVTTVRYPYRHLVLWGNDDGLWIVPADAATPVSPQTVMTKDGRPVAGFKDPRDEHIDERNVKIANLQTHLHHANKRIDELEAQPITRPANPLAGLTDEQVAGIAYDLFWGWAKSSKSTELFLKDLLRDIRDGKLEVPR